MAPLTSISRSIALGFLVSLLIADGARSSTIVYGTAGVVLPFGGQTGPSAVTFTGVPNGAQFTDSSTFSLGTFQVTPPADGSTSSYNNTPFLIQLSGNQVGVANPAITVLNSILIYGRLNGSVSDTSPSSIVATIDAIQPGIVPLNPPGSFNFTQLLPFDPSALKVATNTLLSSDGSGATTLTALVDNTPEPGTLAIFGAIAALGVLRHRSRTPARA
jgi:hypothetical protein